MSSTLVNPKVLIFSRTLGYRHESIPAAIASLRNHSLYPSTNPTMNITFDDTEDPTTFTDDALSAYDAVCFLMTTDSTDTPRVEVLTGSQKV